RQAIKGEEEIGNNRVIANEVKQSHKSKFRLLRRLTPRNDIDGFNETGILSIPIYQADCNLFD
ncbi:hypothetical protein KAU43_06730, partial [candidate division WOR-3 bacterium]|nr:hypothetical protein [candidate division WOR-3 bacterium]